jgi:formamidase
MRAWTERERGVMERGGFAMQPDPTGAVPFSGPVAEEGLRTMPPRENGGNMDMKQMTTGHKLLLPVFVPGALFSAGDGHFAQGDGEICVSAVEIGSTAVVRFRVLKGEAERRNIRAPQVLHESYGRGSVHAGPEHFTATMGFPIRDDGTNDAANLNLAARNALIAMIDVLRDRGFSREQAYVICSAAVDLRISAVVDLPNVLVSAVLDESIFG